MSSVLADIFADDFLEAISFVIFVSGPLCTARASRTCPVACGILKEDPAGGLHLPERDASNNA